MQRERDEAFVARCNEARAKGWTWARLAESLGGIQLPMLLKRRRDVEKRLGIVIPAMVQENRNSKQPIRPAGPMFQAVQPQPRDRSFDDIVSDRLKFTDRQLAAKDSRELIDIALHVSGPFGVAMIGDPHLDNPGCNLRLALEHADLIMRTDRMFAICVGDIQDSWIGRLARLWASQGITASESLVLVNGYLDRLGPKLLALIDGNHDVWAHGVNGQSPTDWIRGRYGTVAEKHGARLRITNDDGETVKINCRHDFPGRSQYNRAHGPSKSLMFGYRDDVAVAGHTHESGRNTLLDPESRRPMHAVRLGSYKHADEYADALGLLDANVSECSVLIVDPLNPDRRHRTQVIDSPLRAAQHLAMLAREWDERQAEAVGGERRPGTQRRRGGDAAPVSGARGKRRAAKPRDRRRHA